MDPPPISTPLITRSYGPGSFSSNLAATSVAAEEETAERAETAAVPEAASLRKLRRELGVGFDDELESIEILDS